jgi:UDP-N-acetylmuramoyl-tripeptide--D-alanyl-D-alanine ligase
MIEIQTLYAIFQKTQRIFTDSRLAGGGGIFVALKGDRFDGNLFALDAIKAGADYALVDHKGLEKNDKFIVVDDALDTLQQLAKHHRQQLRIPVFGITGSNGKTTTKELITAVLAQKYKVLATVGNLNNHIGVPLTLLSIQPGHEIAIIEMGANHPGEIDFLCNIALPNYGLITNVGKAHIEGFGSFEGVKQTKSELYRFVVRSKGEGIFINSDNEHLTGLLPDDVVALSYATTGAKADLVGEVANNDLYLVAKALFPKGWLYLKTKLTGAYNLENVLAAARVGLHFGVDPLLIQKAIEHYTPQNNRSQIKKIDRATFLLDCYNANPSSMVASINNFIALKAEKKALVIGDMLELGTESAQEHQKIIDLLKGSGIDEVFLVGKYFGETDAPEQYKKFYDVEQLKLSVEKAFWQDKFIMVKGSRGIKLEKIID